MELLDVFDENGNFTGVSKPRQKVHEEGLWHKIACVFIINSKGEVLMQKRSEFKMTNPNGWTCSASGHVDAGENALTGALRELEEEIGLNCDLEDLKVLIEKEINISYFNSNIRNYYWLYSNKKEEAFILQKEEANSRKLLDYVALQHNVKLVPKMEVVSQELITEFTNIGLGIGFSIIDLAKRNYKNLKELDINKKIPNINIYLATNKSISLTFASKMFIKYLKY